MFLRWFWSTNYWWVVDQDHCLPLWRGFGWWYIFTKPYLTTLWWFWRNIHQCMVQGDHCLSLQHGFWSPSAIYLCGAVSDTLVMVMVGYPPMNNLSIPLSFSLTWFSVAISNVYLYRTISDASVIVVVGYLLMNSLSRALSCFLTWCWVMIWSIYIFTEPNHPVEGYLPIYSLQRSLCCTLMMWLLVAISNVYLHGTISDAPVMVVVRSLPANHLDHCLLPDCLI